MEACPHLASHKGRYSARAHPEGVLIIESGSDQKAEWFGLCRTASYQGARQANGMLIIQAGPWISVERWRDGAPIAT